MKRTSIANATTIAFSISLTICLAYFVPRRVPDAALREQVAIVIGVVSAILVVYSLGTAFALKACARKRGISDFSMKSDLPKIVNSWSSVNSSPFEYLALAVYAGLHVVSSLWLTALSMRPVLNIYALLFR